jgi:hypothetical protein
MANTVSSKITDEQLNRIIQIESAGKPTAKAPTSSARGLGQFINGTWLAELKKHRPDLFNGPPYDDELKLESDPSLQIEILARFTEDNAAILGPGWTDGDLYLAHFLGVGTAAKFLRAHADASAEVLAGAAAVKANRSILVGKNAGQVRAWAARSMANRWDAAGKTNWVSRYYKGPHPAVKKALEEAMADPKPPAPAPVPVTPIALPAPPDGKPVVAGPPPQAAKHDGVFASIVAVVGGGFYAAWTFLQEWLPEIVIGAVALILLALIIFRLMKGRWPWTGHLSLPSSPVLLPSSPDFSAQQLADRLAALSALSPATRSPARLASRRHRPRSVPRSRTTRQRKPRSKSSRPSTPTRSSSKRKSRSRR